MSENKEEIQIRASALDGPHYNLAKEIIESWPEWKKEIYHKLVKLTT